MSTSISEPWISSLRSRLLDELSARAAGTSVAPAPRRPPAGNVLRDVFAPFPARPRVPTSPTPQPARGSLPVATIFHEPWWLETASDGAYREARVYADGAVVGRLPYMTSKKLGWQTALVMPTMTHVLGPSLSTNLKGVRLTRSLKSFSICGELIAQLPRAAHIWFECHGQTTDTLAFEAAGFSSGVRFTLEIAPAPTDDLWRQMRDKTRNVIRRAQETLTVTEVLDPQRFLDFYEDNLRKRGLRNNYDRRICGNLMTATIARGVGRLLVASDQSGTMQSGIFTAWDHGSEYYLMSTRSPDSGNGATSLLIWNALQHAASLGRIFDMDGVDSRKNLMLFTGFGGVLKPRYFVRRTSAIFQIAQQVKTVLTGRDG